MHEWLVGGAVIQGAEGVLLVQNRRRNGRHDWTPPGGVIDAGESLIEGLAREVSEETGLTVSSWRGPIYEITAEAPGLGWNLRVEAHLGLEVSGALSIDDPDGIVVDARYVDEHACATHLEGNHRWVVEPLLEWLHEPWAGSRSYAYRVDGVALNDLVVVRI